MSEQEQFETEFEQTFEPEVSEVTEPEPVETEAPETFEFQGRQFTREQLDPVAKLAVWASENPERWEQLQKWEAGDLTFAPVQPEPEPTFTPAPEFDPYDETYLRSLGEKYDKLEREVETRTMAEANAAVDAGIGAFSQSHPDLSKDDMAKVLQHVHDRQLLASIPRELPYSAKLAEVQSRFEEGYRVVFYDRVQAEATRQTVNDMTRRRRAAAASSSSVSAPRVTPAPNSPQERHAQFVDEIAQALAEGN